MGDAGRGRRLNICMNVLEMLINDVLNECEYAGTLGDAAADGGPGCFSGDTYAPGDARVPKILGSVITRQGTVRKKKRGQSRNKKPLDKIAFF